MSLTTVVCVRDAAFRWVRSGAASSAPISLLGCPGPMVTSQGYRSLVPTIIVALMPPAVARAA